jgi:hypothetical protein
MLISGASTALFTLLPLVLGSSSTTTTTTPITTPTRTTNNNNKNNKNSSNRKDGEDGEQEQATALFSRACTLLRKFAKQVKVVKRLMQGVLALAWKKGWEIPKGARGAFEGLAEAEERTGLGKGVPLDFVLPVPLSAMEGEEGGGLDLAGLLEEWGAVSAKGEPMTVPPAPRIG